MSLSIQTNVNSLTAQSNLATNSAFQSQTISRLTSGYRINSSGDDAAGLSVANKFRSDAAELTQGVRNANDGVSQLQIIDGGLSNISTMLDRLKTLATQSASSTFTGNRATLNTEYQSLLSEIDRQAANVGLGTATSGSTSDTAAQFSKLLTVYLGGGSNASNATVSVDLSGTKVTSSALGLGGTSVLTGTATSIAASTGVATDLNASTKLLSNNGSQAFTFHTLSTANSVTTENDFTVTLDGGTAGKTGTELVADLNANSELSAAGITASIGSSGELQFSSSNTFTASIAAATLGGGTGTTGVLATTTATGTADNGGMYRVSGTGTYASAATNHETLTFTVGSSTYTVNNDTATTAAAAVADINSQLADAGATGIQAVLNAAGTNVEFQSSSSFTLSSVGTTATAGGIFASVTGTTVAQTITEGDTSSATANATAAIAAIEEAVTALGTVSGKIGSAENTLKYAIDLATSQITNYSSAQSQIRDADVASEAANLTKASVLQQATIAAMAQANSAPQAVLSLLKG
jgi:flagellin